MLTVFQDLLKVQAEGTRRRREGEVRSEGRGPGYETLRYLKRI